jgi:prevent-host-death family protein
MTEVGSRDLRNDTAGVLRRVQAGEDITITVKGRPVAVLTATPPTILGLSDEPDTRAQRLATLESVADMEMLPVDEEAARMWARLRIHLAETGLRVRINDLWIAAIAASRTLPVITQDDDFAALDGAGGLTVIKV